MATDTELRELDMLVAYHLFGWRWFRSKSRSLCTFQPPEGGNFEQVGSWIRAPWGENVYDPVEGIPPAAERFSDWDAHGWRVLGQQQFKSGVPHFTRDHAAMMEVMEKLPAVWEIVYSSEKRRGSARAWISGQGFGLCEIHANRPLAEAVCVAALAALGVMVS